MYIGNVLFVVSAPGSMIGSSIGLGLFLQNIVLGDNLLDAVDSGLCQGSEVVLLEHLIFFFRLFNLLFYCTFMLCGLCILILFKSAAIDTLLVRAFNRVFFELRETPKAACSFRWFFFTICVILQVSTWLLGPLSPSTLPIYIALILFPLATACLLWEPVNTSFDSYKSDSWLLFLSIFSGFLISSYPGFFDILCPLGFLGWVFFFLVVMCVRSFVWGVSTFLWSAPATTSISPFMLFVLYVGTLEGIVFPKRWGLSANFWSFSRELETFWGYIPAVAAVYLCILPTALLLYFSESPLSGGPFRFYESADVVVGGEEFFVPRASFSRRPLTVLAVGTNMSWEYHYMFNRGVPTKASLLPDQTLAYYAPKNINFFPDNHTLYLPSKRDVRLMVSSTDYVYVWQVEGLGIKLTGYPGTLNKVDLYLTQTGCYAWGISEVCGSSSRCVPIKVIVY